MKFGKLTAAELQSGILDVIKARRNEVIVGPAAGEDCAVIRATEGLVFLSSDPITGATSDLGYLAVHINCNDIAASGAEPLGLMVVLLMPPTADVEDVKNIMLEIEEAAKSLRIDVLGGHTEFTPAVNRPVVCATGVGMARKAIKSRGVEPGDYIVMTKTAGIEGTYILAKDFVNKLEQPSALKNAPEITGEDISDALTYLKKISVLPESRIMLKHEATGMHDATEGGVFGAAAELCRGAGLGASLQESKIPVSGTTRKFCARLGLNPYKLLSGGSMLCTLKKPKPLIDELQAAGIEAAVIGRMTERGAGVASLGKRGAETQIEAEPDELNKLFTE